MWYQISDIPNLKGHVVYKLFYKNKYVVIAGKTIQRSIENINVGLKYFFLNTKKGRNPNDRYYKFYCYVAENPFDLFRVEVISESDNPLSYLKSEHTQLQIAKEDQNCLNIVFEVYIPQFTQVNGKKSWINRGYYLNFRNWLLANQNKPVSNQSG